MNTQHIAMTTNFARFDLSVNIALYAGLDHMEERERRVTLHNLRYQVGKRRYGVSHPHAWTKMLPVSINDEAYDGAP